MNILKYIKNKKVIVGVIIIIIIGGIYLFINNGKEVNNYGTLKVILGELRNEVDVTGKVKSQKTVSLAFEQSGKVENVYVSVGVNVQQGKILIRLENQNEYGALLKAEANLNHQQTILDELLRGARREEINVQETNVLNAKQVSIEARKDVTNKIIDTFTKLDDAVRSKSDQLFDGSRTTQPSLKSNLYSSNTQLVIDVESLRVVVEGILNKQAIRNASLDTEIDLSAVIQDTKKDINSVKVFLDKLSLIVNGLIVNNNLSNTTIDGYKTDINTARTNINTALTNLTNSENSLSVSLSNLSLQKKKLILLEAPATIEDITAQKFVIASKEADLVQAKAVFSKTILRAPIPGIITMQNAKKGEIVLAGEPVVEIITKGRFKIEVFVPEADIARIKIGDKASLTLDAYSADEIFKAEVYLIDPAETVIDGVSTYKVTLKFSDDEERIKSGMTANVKILTDEKLEVIAVPARAIKTNSNGDKVLRVMHKDGSIEERIIKTGLRGSDGRVEVVSGLNKNEEVITFEK